MNLTRRDAAVIEHLKIKNVVPNESDITPVAPRKKTATELLAERRQARSMTTAPKSKYIPALKKCVLGSAAEVERLWSMAGKVLTKERSTMSPHVFEIIMYLKYNRDLWDLVDVVEANKRRKNKSTARKARKEAHCQRVVQTRTEIKACDDEMGIISEGIV